MLDTSARIFFVPRRQSRKKRGFVQIQHHFILVLSKRKQECPVISKQCKSFISEIGSNIFKTQNIARNVFLVAEYLFSDFEGAIEWIASIFFVRLGRSLRRLFLNGLESDGQLSTSFLAICRQRSLNAFSIPSFHFMTHLRLRTSFQGGDIVETFGTICRYYALRNRKRCCNGFCLIHLTVVVSFNGSISIPFPNTTNPSRRTLVTPNRDSSARRIYYRRYAQFFSHSWRTQ